MPKSPVPPAILDQHVAILGKTRSGKSSVMRGLVESLLARHLPVCIIDPKGDWYGIKLAADGKGPGYPVAIFGGEHADIPITEHAGAHIAELFATGNRPCLIDLGGWMVGPRTRFWIDFASTLFKHTKGQRWLAIDEIHNVAPKGKVFDADAGKMLHWTNRLASEGLGKGLALIFASQRPQKVHNDTLTSAETLIAMRVLHPSDREAIADWIKGCGDGSGAEVLTTVAQMARGEGWVWSPEIHFGPTRVTFPLFSTYDSFRPQTSADAKRLKGWAEVDLDDVRTTLAAVVEEAAANDPKELKRQVVALTQQIREKDRRTQQLETQRTHVDGPAVALAAKAAHTGLTQQLAQHRRALQAALKMLATVQAIDVTVDTAAGVEALAAAVADATRHVTAPFEKRVTALATRVEGLQHAAAAAQQAIAAVLDAPIDQAPFAVRRDRIRPELESQMDRGTNGQRATPPTVASGPAAKDPRLASGGRWKKVVVGITTVLAQAPEGRTRTQILILAGYQPSGDVSSAFGALLEHDGS